jgi:hypothetical protein
MNIFVQPCTPSTHSAFSWISINKVLCLRSSRYRVFGRSDQSRSGWPWTMIAIYFLHVSRDWCPHRAQNDGSHFGDHTVDTTRYLDSVLTDRKDRKDNFVLERFPNLRKTISLNYDGVAQAPTHGSGAVAILSPCGGWNLRPAATSIPLNTRTRTTPPRPPWRRHARSIIAIYPFTVKTTCRTEPAGCSRTRAPTPISGVVSANRLARGSFPIKGSHHNRTPSELSRSFYPRIPRAIPSRRTTLLP